MGDGMDYGQMMQRIEELRERYGFLSVSYMGSSVMGRGIPMLSLGEGERQYIYVGGHGADEWRTAAILIRWIGEYCSIFEKKGRILRFGSEYLFRSRTVSVIPMLNPDGMEYRKNGIAEDHVMRDRLISMNRGSPDFGKWKANGRGVDLRYNYASLFEKHKREERESGILGGCAEQFSGESSESEPEVGYLCNYLRYVMTPRLVVSLHEGTPSLYCKAPLGQEPKSRGAEQAFSRMLGIGSRGEADGLVETVADELGVLGCAVGVGILGSEDPFLLYGGLREFLFVAPTMV